MQSETVILIAAVVFAVLFIALIGLFLWFIKFILDRQEHYIKAIIDDFRESINKSNNIMIEAQQRQNKYITEALDNQTGVIRQTLERTIPEAIKKAIAEGIQRGNGRKNL